MYVKCRCCGNPVDKNLAYKIERGKTNYYYCSEQEYIKMTTDKARMKELECKIFDIVNEIFEYKVTNTILFKELKEIKQNSSLEKIYAYLDENKNDIVKYMSQKVFTNEYNKIRYFSAIIKNNIIDYELPKEEIVQELPKEEVIKELLKEETIKQEHIEIYDAVYVSKRKRKSIGDHIKGCDESE